MLATLISRILVGAQQSRIIVQRHVEAARIVELRDEADVGRRGGVAEQELARLGRGERFQRGQALADPVRVPGVDLFLQMAERALEIFEHAKIVQRVDVAGDGHRHRNHVRPLRGPGREERLAGVS